MAARRARAAAGAAGGRVYQTAGRPMLRAFCGRVPQRPQRNRLCRRPERDGRVPLAGGPIRSPAGTDGRSGPPTCGRDRHARHHTGCARGQSCNSDDPDRLRRRRRPGPAWSCRQPRPAGRQRDRHQFFPQEVVAKRLRLLHDLVPKAVRIAVLVNPANAATAESTLRDVQEAAPSHRAANPDPQRQDDRRDRCGLCQPCARAPRCPLRRSRRILRQPPRAICHLDGARTEFRRLMRTVILSRPAG